MIFSRSGPIAALLFGLIASPLMLPAPGLAARASTGGDLIAEIDDEEYTEEVIEETIVEEEVIEEEVIVEEEVIEEDDY